MKILVITILFLLMNVPAFGHSWYPKACCHDLDCSPVTKQSPQPDGTIIVTDEMGRTITVPANAKPKLSQDERYHVCAVTKYRNPMSLDDAEAVEDKSPYLFMCWFEPGGV